MEIVPAIIGNNIEEIADKIKKVQGAVKWVQIDVMDGVFAPIKSWPYTAGNISDLSKIDVIRTDDIKLEFHLMVKDPETIIPKLVEYGADRIVFHFEATEKYSEIIKFLEGEEVEIVVSLKMKTPISVIDDFIGEIDGVQFMGINEIGSYGRVFDEQVLERIAEIKEKYPGLFVSIDGGVNLDNAGKLLDAGVENLVVGSALFGKDDPKEQISKFRELER